MTATTSPEVAPLSKALHELMSILDANLVLLFDGLDRLMDMDLFVGSIRQDLPILKASGIGVVIVGPQHIRFGAQWPVHELFTDFHLHGAAHVSDEGGLSFLKQVLRCRVDPDILPDGSIEALARASGGLLRDLISMARTAGEEAYSAGLERVEIEQVEAAAQRLGRGLLLGLTDQHLEALRSYSARGRRVNQQSHAITIATQVDIDLLLGRIIIEVPSVPPRYRLHPAVIPLLDGLRKSA